MKNLMIFKAVIVLLLVSSNVYAQEMELSEDQLEQILNRIEETKTRLNLTEEQSKQIRPILEENIQGSLEVLRKYGFERGHKPSLNFRQKLALRKDMNAVRDVTDAKLGAVLNDEQMDEYEDIRDERRKAMRERLGL